MSSLNRLSGSYSLTVRRGGHHKAYRSSLNSSKLNLVFGRLLTVSRTFAAILLPKEKLLMLHTKQVILVELRVMPGPLFSFKAIQLLAGIPVLSFIKFT